MGSRITSLILIEPDFGNSVLTKLFEADKKDELPRANVYHNFKERDYDFSELEKKFARN